MKKNTFNYDEFVSNENLAGLEINTIDELVKYSNQIKLQEDIGEVESIIRWAEKNDISINISPEDLKTVAYLIFNSKINERFKVNKILYNKEEFKNDRVFIGPDGILAKDNINISWEEIIDYAETHGVFNT